MKKLEIYQEYLTSLSNEKQKMRSVDLLDLDTINQYCSCETVEKLLTTAEEFIKYIKKHPIKLFNLLFDNNIFGAQTFLDGLVLKRCCYFLTLS